MINNLQRLNYELLDYDYNIEFWLDCENFRNKISKMKSENIDTETVISERIEKLKKIKADQQLESENFKNKIDKMKSENIDTESMILERIGKYKKNQLDFVKRRAIIKSMKNI